MEAVDLYDWWMYLIDVIDEKLWKNMGNKNC